MEEFKVALPKDCNLEKITTKVEDGNLIVVYEPKKEFKFGDYVAYKDKDKCFGGIVVGGLIGTRFSILNPLASDKSSYYIEACDKNFLSYADDELKRYIIDRMDSILLTINCDTEKIERKRWRAKYKEPYYYITESGEIRRQTECRDEIDDTFYKIGNYYQTEELAEQALPFVLAAYKYNNK